MGLNLHGAMQFIRLSSLITAGILFARGSCQEDPCDNHTDISDERRSVVYESKDGNYLCDHGVIQDGNWYTFDAHTGGTMPETCPEFYSCGTQAPIWFNGVHPTDSEVHDATVCVNINSCCEIEYDIQVKKCPDEKYIYRLAEPVACDLAYCAGSGLPCEPGKVWVESRKNCSEGYPVMSGPPHLSDPIAPEDLFRGTFKFKCTINYSDDDGRAMFEVHWYFDNEEDPNVGPEQINGTEAYLDELKLVGHVGKTVSCGARSYWPDHPNTPSDTLISDNGYWVGIKVPAEVNLSESEADTTIEVESTVPITCGCCRKTEQEDGFIDLADCQFKIKMNSAPKLTNAPSDCIAIFNPSKRRANFTLSPEREYIQRRDLTQVFYQDVTYNKSDSVTAIWKDYNIGPSKVHITNDQRMGHCESITDPHIKSFDRMSNKLPYYHLFQPGKFKLVTSTSPRVLEIHSVLRTCELNTNVACNCGVAIREGNLIFGVDNCNGTFRTFKKTLVDGTLNDGTLTTNAAGTTFTIVMPSGAKIVAREDKSWHLNVDVYLPSEFYNTTSGLCGTWDGDASNDFQLQFSDEIVSSSESQPKKFTDSFRIPKEQSFFETNPCVELLDPEDFYYCRCAQGKVNCIHAGTVTDVAIDNKYPNVCAKKRKRQADDFKLVFADLAEEEEDIQPIELIWPTLSGITEEEAIKKCDEVLQESLAYDLCQNVVTVDTKELKSVCTLDIQIADNLTVAKAMQNVFENTCIEEAHLNVVSGTNDTDDPLTTLVESIASIICINQCSGHGVCNNGTCDCDIGYLGADCSFHKGTAPTIQDVAYEGICDTYLGTCHGIKMSADVVISGAVCRFTSIQVIPEGQIRTEGIEPEISESTILSNTKVFCELPSTKKNTFATYNLALSLDGEIFSEEIVVSIFDSVCVACTSEGFCTIKPDTCAIDGKCYTGSTCTACKEAIDIGHPKRSTAYETQANESQRCDASQIEEGKWYRFNQYTGKKIPEQCISTGHCGTKNTIWLDGMHPTADAPVTTGITCANYYNEGCCDWSAPVTVKYCREDEDQPFYAYQLMPPPSCETAYCSGDIIPCAEGEVWDEDNEACIDVADGTEIAISSDSLDELIENEEAFKEAIADGINKYCATHTEECCQAMDLEMSHSSTKTVLATSSSVTVIVLEENEDTTDIGLVIVVDIATTRAFVFCGSENDDDSLTMNDEIVAEAITASSDVIKEETGIVITHVGKQTEEKVTNDVTDPNLPEDGIKKGLIIGVTAGGVLALAAAAIIIVMCAMCAKKKKKKSSAQRSLSRMTVASGKNIQGIHEIGPQVTDPDLFLTSKPPHYFNYAEMRPTTGVKKNTSLTPLGN